MIAMAINIGGMQNGWYAKFKKKVFFILNLLNITTMTNYFNPRVVRNCKNLV